MSDSQSFAHRTTHRAGDRFGVARGVEHDSSDWDVVRRQRLACEADRLTHRVADLGHVVLRSLQ